MTPTAIRIPSIGVDSNDFVQVGLDKAGAMEVPPLSKPREMAWFSRSPAPGDLGPSVIVSHRNGNGMQGGFAKLDAVKVGATVEVDRSDGKTMVFKVRRSELYSKAQADAHADEVYGDTIDPELRLITCSGELDAKHHNYLSQRVVMANLDSIKATM